jgi:methionyl-tRNA formyltransferase
MGTGEIGVPALRMMLGREGCEVVAVVTQPDRAAGRGNAVREAAIKVVAREAGIPILQPERLREAGAVAELAGYSPDLVVVMAYGQILSRAVLDVPAVASWNLHASLLPRWRGAAPIQAAIRAGDAVTGVTVMHMAEGLDTGDIVLTEEIEISADETGGSLHDRLADVAAVALGRALDLLAEGRTERAVQDESRVTVTRKLSREDGRIEWSQSAVAIERLVRAMDPWPGAWCEFLVGGAVRRVKVWAVEIGEAGAAQAAPAVGAVGETEGRVVVGTGEGVIVLREVQAEGRKRMSAGEWWRGVVG